MVLNGVDLFNLAVVLFVLSIVAYAGWWVVELRLHGLTDKMQDPYWHGERRS